MANPTKLLTTPTSFTAANPYVITTDAAHTAGNPIVVVLSCPPTTGPSVTDQVGNVYLLLFSQSNSTFEQVQLWVSNGAIALPSGNTITASFTTLTGTGLMGAVQCPGYPSNNDSFHSGTGNSATPNDATGVTTKAVSTLVFCAWAVASATGGAATEDGAFTTVYDQVHSGSAHRLHLAYLVKAASGATTYSATTPGSARWAIGLAGIGAGGSYRSSTGAGV